MGINELLFWLSANGRGSWGRFRSAAEVFLPASETTRVTKDRPRSYQRARFALQQLGHVEFDCHGCAGGWRVAPSVLALVERNDGLAGFLCGARLPELVAAIETDLAQVQYEQIPHPEQPDVIRFFVRDVAVVRVAAERANVHLQLHAPISMISSLPQVAHLSQWHARPSTADKETS